jgi:hypothetical protein
LTSFSLNEAFLIFILLYGIGCILLTIFFIKRLQSLLITSIVFIILSFVFIPNILYWITRINSNECVIIENTSGRSGPGENFQEIVEFQEGLSGKVLKRDDGWYLFSSGEEIGWINGGLKFIIEK